ncbi:glycosyltransferase family 2 protein [Desulfoglaeba alkanexedens]|uniref:Glycosyltransferase n=1 Tax=Desulfoglaeba alkanexedens ALDC TaxID=980445 RepID=A0A4V1ERI7_9BACT|nr:glycosyltransferase family 2 protein [Desulfoglaeba alkanexedens]QCQ21781.1 glycosyltransferase [Desulfoglaeba alkanexedens ALDC]
MNHRKPFSPYRLAVLVPCYNEARSIAAVIRDFKESLPGAEVYVYDNNSSDGTALVAREAGAVVRSVIQQGKGNVVRRMFADIDADVYVLVDGDDTYDASSAPVLVSKLLDEQLDMVVGTRFGRFETTAFRAGHKLGNRLLTRCVALLFGRTFTDMLSGYRVFSRRFVKSFPALAQGFETETELTVHALELRMPIAEIETPYRSRPEGSTSKLRTYRDGWRILMMILTLFREERPLAFFMLVFGALASTSLALAVPIVVTYLKTGLVPRFPTAILSTGMMLLAFLSLTAGFILDTVTRGRLEMKRLFYLSVPAVGNGKDSA